MSPSGKGDMSLLRIDVDALTPAERRDFANALLHTASTAAFEETRILLLDLLIEVDNTIASEPA